MLTLWNRKEVAATYNMGKQANIRNLLADNQIDYEIKTINRNSPSALSDTRARTGTFGQNMDIAYEYIVYVHKKDYETVAELLRRAGI